MTKNTAKLSDEEIEFLASEASKKAKNTSPMMKQLAINADKVDANGKKLEVDTWHIRGESTYVDTVQFRPLRYKQKFIRMNQVDKKWKTDCESIFVEGFEPAYDSSGGLACGRLIGKLPTHWTEEQKLANYKKATIYGFLFGLVTIADQKPLLVNFRAAPAKATAIREAINNPNLGGADMYRYDFTMKLVPVQGEKFVTLEMTPNLKAKHESIADVLPYIKEIDAYVEAHNGNIMRRREQLISNLKAANTFTEVKAISDDFSDLEEEPFKSMGK